MDTIGDIIAFLVAAVLLGGLVYEMLFPPPDDHDRSDFGHGFEVVMKDDPMKR